MRGRLTGYHPNNFSLPETEAEMLEIMLGALLTQNTSWINAEKALFELYSQNLIDINALLNIPTENLAILIKSSGYYNQKAIKIRALVQYLSEHPISTLLTRSIEDLRPEIRGVKGCGNETCDSILLYALKKPIFVVDSYTKRLLIRLGLIPESYSYETIQDFFEQNLPKSMELYNEFHALIVQHAVHCCLKKPICESCPFGLDCAKLILESLPKKSTNKSLKKYSKNPNRTP